MIELLVWLFPFPASLKTATLQQALFLLYFVKAIDQGFGDSNI